MPSVRPRIASTCRWYPSVYPSEAPSGATVIVMKNPRSSGGTNSCLRDRNTPTATTTVATAPPITSQRCRSAVRSATWYVSVILRKVRSNTWKTRPCVLGTSSTLAHSIGVSVSATQLEMTTATARVMPNSLNSRPVVPCRKASGENTATSATVVAITANAISLVPFRAASSGVSPSSS